MLATSSDNALPVYLHGITKLGEQYHARYHLTQFSVNLSKMIPIFI